jgi:hypothetical protein
MQDRRHRYQSVGPKRDGDSGEKQHQPNVYWISHPCENSSGHEREGWFPRLDVSTCLEEVAPRENCYRRAGGNEDRANDQPCAEAENLTQEEGGKNQSSARPSSKVASAIRGGGAITPGLSRASSI